MSVQKAPIPRLFLAVLLLLRFMGGSSAHAVERPEVEALMAEATTHSSAINDRAIAFSGLFLGSPYVGGPLGEGPSGRYDQDPLYRFDAFDCTTYVETVIALSFSNTFEEFESRINQVRYAQGLVSFPTRNHFTDADWNPNLVGAGFLEEITARLALGRTTVAEAVVDRASWYQHMALAQLNLPGTTDDERRARLEELHAEGRHFQPELVRIPYISIDTLFDGIAPDLHLDPSIVDGFPDVSVVNFVRPNWDLVAAAGTHLNVSHQGIVVKRNGVLYLRHASSARGVMSVSEIPFQDYLSRFLNHPTLRGINILRMGTPTQVN